MKRWIKRTIKITLITLASVVGVVVLVVAAAMYLIFTPSRLTPIVEQVASEYIAADLTFSSVELTLFGTFPDVNLKITQGLLRSRANDSLAMTDSIVSFKSVDVTLNPMDFIFRNQVSIRNVTLDEPIIYAFVDSTGRANWDVFVLPVDTLAVADTSSFSAEIDLRNFVLSGGRMTYDDRKTKIFGRLDSLNFALKGRMSTASDVEASMAFRRGLFWQDGKVLTKKLKVQFDVNGHYDSATEQLDVKNASLAINDITITAAGSVRREDLELDASVLSPTLSTVVSLLPRAYVASADKMNAKGSVMISGKVKGKYREGLIPTAEIIVKIVDGGFHYTGYQYGIDQLNLDAKAFVDVNEISNSRVDITNLYVNSDAITMNLNGVFDDILSKTRFQATVDVDVDFAKLVKTIPMTQEMNVNGQACFKGEISSSLDQISSQLWKKVLMKGQLEMRNLSYFDTLTNTRFTTTSAAVSLDHTKSDELLVNGDFQKLFLSQMPLFSAKLDKANVDIKTLNSADSSKNYLRGKVSYKDLTAALFDDKIRVYSSSSDIAINMKADKSRLRFRTDTLRVETPKSNAMISRAGVNVTVGRKLLRGSIGFTNISVNTPFFPLPISLDSTLLKVDNNKIELSRANIKVGRSDLQMSGYVENLLSTKVDKTIVIRGNILSKSVNLNQIIRAIDKGSVHTQQIMNQYFTAPVDTLVAVNEVDTVALPVISVPSNIDADLTIDVSRIRFAKLKLTDAHGRVMINDGKTHFQDLRVSYAGSHLNLNTQYAYAGGDSAVVNVAMTADSLQVKTIKAIIPTVDSMFPMINDLNGTIGLKVFARAPMKTVMIPKLETIDLATDLYGEGIAISNNPTFQSLAKMLMFKEKQHNEIDSIHVQAIVQNGVVDIIPFSMEIDRYRLAVGGKQYLNGNLNYHISILKSPIPFKFGINITGSFDEFKIGIGKTLYKQLFPAYGPIRKDSPEYIKLRDDISEPLK